MKHLRRFNESKVIKAKDDTIKEIVNDEVNKLGDDADLNHIDVSEVTNMNSLFSDNENFNGDISRWNTENVLSMTGMFYKSQFNGDIYDWNVGNVRFMVSMFCDSKFNGDISNWNVENVERMDYMFWSSKFNGDISNWNVENVENMNGIFLDSKFGGNLNKWKPKSFKFSINMFFESPLDKDEPIWWRCLRWGLFNSGEDYCDSLKYGWLREKTIFTGRLETVIELFNGDLNNIDKIKDLKGFTYQN